MQKSKCKDIALRIRRLILGGDLKPGEQLPTRTELERKFKVSKATMQKTIDSLVKDGTVYADGTNGTFVSEYPKEIYHYGIVFHYKPGYDSPWERHLKIILQEANNIFSKTPCSLSVFYGDKYHLDADWNLDFLEDIRNKRMAGLIIQTHPAFFEGTEIMGDHDIPTITMSPGSDCKLPSVSCCDLMGIEGEMAKYLSGRKHARTAVVLSSRRFRGPGYLDKLMDEMKKHGLETHESWLLGADILFPKSIANIICLMMRNEHFRPDSIMILDDNLIEGVIRGIKESGMRVPGDVELVALVNFPYNERLDVPVKMFGFDISEQLRIAKLKLEAIRQKHKYEKTTILKFISDTEYEKGGKSDQ